MYFENNIKFSMENSEAANTALAAIKKVLYAGDYSRGYMINTAEKLANSLLVKDSQIVPKELDGYFTVEDIYEVAKDIVIAVAHIDSILAFECEVNSVSTYTDGEFEASYKDGLLRIKEVFYPSGYYESVPCPECGSNVVRIEDYVPNRTYICPECGEEVDLSKMYDEVVPIITEENFEIK